MLTLYVRSSVTRRSYPRKNHIHKLPDASTFWNGTISESWGSSESVTEALPSSGVSKDLGWQPFVSFSMRENWSSRCLSTSHHLGFWIFALDQNWTECLVFTGPRGKEWGENDYILSRIISSNKSWELQVEAKAARYLRISSNSKACTHILWKRCNSGTVHSKQNNKG